VRIEREHDRLEAAEARVARRVREHGLMATMNSVEIADRDEAAGRCCSLHGRFVANAGVDGKRCAAGQLDAARAVS
jgi:hypothetical protein